MMGVDGPQLYMNFLKPRIKVGNEFVTQGRNVNQVNYEFRSLSTK
jgi:myosin heavy chain 6/7